MPNPSRRHGAKRRPAANVSAGSREAEAQATDGRGGFNLDSYLVSVLKEALQAVNTSQGSLMLLNAQDDTLEIVAQCGQEFDPKRKHRRFRVSEGVAGWVVRNQEARLSDDVCRDDQFKPALGELNFRSLLAVPITTRAGRVIGVMCADKKEPGQFCSHDEALLRQAAGHIAERVEQAAVDTLIRLRKRLKSLESLYEVGQKLSQLTFESPEELPTLLRQITESAELVLNADLISLYQYYEKESRFEAPPTIAGKCNHPEWMKTTVRSIDAPARVVREGQSLYAENAQRDSVMQAPDLVSSHDRSSERRSFVDREDVVSSAGILMRGGKEIVGVMFVNYRVAHVFSDDERYVLETFAAHAAVAIQGARRVRDVIKARQEGRRQSMQMVAHRLRNVLVPMSDRLRRALGSESLSATGSEYCRIALVQCQRAEEIVRDFERFSLAESFECNDQLSSSQLVARLVGNSQATRLQSDGRIKMLLPAREVIVRVNLGRLLDDFVAFTRDSERHRTAGLTVCIGGEVVAGQDVERVGLDPQGTFLKVVYEDNGPGISADIKSRIFDPFFTTTKGAGLGLSIALHDAKTHRGTLVETGSPGTGVRFELFLPAEPMREDGFDA